MKKIISLFTLLFIITLSVKLGMTFFNNKTQQMETNNQYTNSLIHETSPYLLQHAHNPVNWHAWNKETLEKAKRENKAILVSIGYSTCHWCHVMEHESFEDTTVAKLMNEKFICIKVDREEHPDVDKYYMDAVQLLTGSGGWPLNAIALPDGRPIWGGTYFPKERWKQALTQVSDVIVHDPSKAEEYAVNIQSNIKSNSSIINDESDKINLDDMASSMRQLSQYFDYEWGGMNRAPKFPQANNYRFILNYLHLNNDEKLSSYLETTLEKIAFGGIHDWVGGGFARYSVDKYWKAPHFEKMLYDNAQLMRLYSEAYKQYKNPLYKKMVYSINEYIIDEMLSSKGAFYSALDADSEGVEGKYYIWQSSELKELIGNGYQLFADYFNVEENGNWEHESNILISSYSVEEYSRSNEMNPEKFETKLLEWKEILKKEREKRVAPSKDNKTIVSWNALMSLGYLEAYKTFNDETFLEIAKNNIDYILKNALKSDLELYHTVQNGKGKINAYLDDYALLIELLIEAYQVIGDEEYLKKAVELTEYSLDKFYVEESKMFSFTNENHDKLFNKSYEVDDNVIPSSNSVMAHNLFKLGRIIYNDEYLEISSIMSDKMSLQILKYPLGYSNWAILKLWEQQYSEIAVLGDSSESFKKQIQQLYKPNTLVVSSNNSSEIELLKSRYVEGKTLIYVCKDKSCKMPVDRVEDAF